MSQGIQARLDAHIVRGKHVRSLVDSADARRAHRAEEQIDVDEVLDGVSGVIRSTVQSSDGDRQYSVTITPVTAQGDHYDWRWSCTCPDASKGVHGPCKHTIAVADHWLTEQARPMFLFLRSLLAPAVEPEPEPAEDDGDYRDGPKPGTWAHTARMMAGPNPTEEDGRFWDDWKEEMKMRDF